MRGKEIRKTLAYGDSFLSKDKRFYRDFVSVMFYVALQNIITYSVNVTDNIMLGVYSQTAFSGAASINQLQFIFQNVLNSGFGGGLVIIAARFWGGRETEKIQKLIGCAMTCGLCTGILLTVATCISPYGLAGLFTKDTAILTEAVSYLRIVRWTYIPFAIICILYSSLRSCQVVNIAFWLSIMCLFLNSGINYILIYGKFGAPELGIVGAAIGTLVTRYTELGVLLLYCAKTGLPIEYRISKIFQMEENLWKRYLYVTVPSVIASFLFSFSFALQTAVMGHLSADAIAANGYALTIFQYCKMIPLAAASSGCVWIGKTIGSGNLSTLRQYVRSIQVICIVMGLIVGALFYLIGSQLFVFYSLSDQAVIYVKEIVAVLTFILICTSIQAPSLTGIILGGGDSKYVMYNDFVFAFMSIVLGITTAFVWKLPVGQIVLFMNIDQCIKVVTAAGIKTHSYTWIKNL